MNIENNIRELITNAVEGLLLPEVDFVIEHPKDLDHGDFSSNVAMVLAKHEGKNPKELAEEFVRYIVQKNLEDVEKVEVAGPGFINFHLSKNFFRHTIAEILDSGVHWGRNDSQKGMKVMVEYTQPNPFKEMHIGHFMSNTIGESIARLEEFTGAEVIRANYQGDVGPHVAKAIYGMQQSGNSDFTPEDLGKAYAVGAKAYEESEASKKEIDVLNKKVYEKDSSILDLYNKGRTVSLEQFEVLYKKLGTAFNEYYFESVTWVIGKTMLDENKNVFEESEGAIIFKGEDVGLHTRVFFTSQGMPTYEVKELGLFKKKFDDYELDVSITTTAKEQQEYFKVVRAALDKIYPDINEKTRHVIHGFMKLPTGKMSSRTGDVITTESLIAATEEKIEEKMEGREVSDKDFVKEAVAVGALKFSILKQATGRDVVFDFDKALSFEGDSGPYLQYAHTRAQSILKKATEAGITAATEQGLEAITNLEKVLFRFPNIVLRAQKEQEPHFITTYLVQLASAFNSFYANERILNAADNPKYKVALTRAFELTIFNGLYLLGIRAPEEM